MPARARLGEAAGGRTINMELGELSRALGHKWSALWPRVRKLEENHDVGRALSPEEEGRLLTMAGRRRLSQPKRRPLPVPLHRAFDGDAYRRDRVSALVKHRTRQLDDDVGRAKTTAGTGRQIPINADMVTVLDEHARWYSSKIGAIQAEWYVFLGRQGKAVRGRHRPLDPTKPHKRHYYRLGRAARARRGSVPLS
jgi:hypothetical protein